MSTIDLIKDANERHKILRANEELYNSRKNMELSRNHLIRPLKMQQNALRKLADQIASNMFKESGFYIEFTELRDAVRARYSGKLKFE